MMTPHAYIISGYQTSNIATWPLQVLQPQIPCRPKKLLFFFQTKTKMDLLCFSWTPGFYLLWRLEFSFTVSTVLDFSSFWNHKIPYLDLWLVAVVISHWTMSAACDFGPAHPSVSGLRWFGFTRPQFVGHFYPQLNQIRQLNQIDDSLFAQSYVGPLKNLNFRPPLYPVWVYQPCKQTAAQCS